MPEKPNFHGDVGQAVLGNVHEAQHQNNVVNLTVGNPCHEATALPCAACMRQTLAMPRAGPGPAAQWVLLLAAPMLCGWLLFSAVDAAQGSAERRCFFDGKAYSMGGAIVHPDGSIRECVIHGAHGVPRWAMGART